MEGGRTIETPAYVFDTLAWHAPVAKAAELATKATSAPQRVVWRHYRAEQVSEDALLGRPAREREQRRWWLHGTNLLRPYREADGIEGISWLICLGQAVSCGISLDAESPEAGELDAEQILERLEQAWARRGVDLVERFPERTAAEDFRHAYFVRERAYGRNWLLAGGSFAQFWYPGSLGLWTATAVSGSAPALLEEPERIGAWYEAAMRRCLQTHESWDAMVHAPPFSRREEPYRFWARTLSTILPRMADYLQMAEGRYADDWNERYLRWLGSTYHRRPTMQLLLWGLTMLRTEHVPELARQAEAFEGYFHPLPFHVGGYLRGIGPALSVRAQ